MIVQKGLVWLHASVQPPIQPMKTAFVLLTLFLALANAHAAGSSKPESLFDGKTFKGWNGDTNKTWRIEDGAFVAGRLTETVPHNEFIATDASFTNFVLRLKFKLEGKEGFVNGGVQVRSQRVSNPAFEMSGYQADMGDGWWGALYDESRRNKVLVKPSDEVIAKALKRGEWNDYEVRCQGQRVQIFLNGHQTVDYTEQDKAIETSGTIGLQVHGGGKTRVSYKDITLERLP